MVVGHPGWSPVIPHTTRTVTAITRATETVVVKKSYGQVQPIADMHYLDHTYLILLLISIPLFYITTRWRKQQLRAEVEEKRARAIKYEVPWATPRWLTLYGLLAMTYSISDMPCPFERDYVTSIQKRFNNPKRFALKRLLEKGIIPLHIRDGGITTRKRQSWALSSTFPWIKLPLYEQTKRRAYFDFIVPHTERPEVKAFVRLVNMENQHQYAFSFAQEVPRSGRDDRCQRGKGSGAGRAYQGDEFPLAVGAWSPSKIFLPLRPDRVLVPAGDEKVGYVRKYVRGRRADTVPLLKMTSTIVIRVEAGHWGYVELEDFVLYAAQEARLPTAFPIHASWEAAERELRRCGIPTGVYFEPRPEAAEEVQDEDGEDIEEVA
jgi:hypothetical protein